jgi:hypothetical protein
MPHEREPGSAKTVPSLWRDERFLPKRPDMKASAIIKRCGDNIYEPTKAGSFRQLPQVIPTGSMSTGIAYHPPRPSSLTTAWPYEGPPRWWPLGRTPPLP